MSDQLAHFISGDRACAVALGYDLEARFAQWDALRKRMARAVPAAFTRDEWAYLVTFLDRENLREPFAQSFGEPAPSGKVGALFRPRGPIAIWLPNNVSLLGPLTLILTSFAARPIRVKTGSRSNDLCSAFVAYALENLPPGELADWLRADVKIERFARDDERNKTFAAEAAVRIVFGSDAAATGIHSLPHPVSSIGITFADHRSEAWVEMAALDDARLSTLIRVFAIYGQAGCTSPRRVVVIDGTAEDCATLRRRMIALWREEVPMHIASQNILSNQLAATAGWDAQLAPHHAAVLGVGSFAQRETPGLMSLAIIPATAAEAAAALPTNIQTVGHCLSHADAPGWLALLARTTVKRWVPIARMHHFGAVWDGVNFWRQLFGETFIDP